MRRTAKLLAGSLMLAAISIHGASPAAAGFNVLAVTTTDDELIVDGDCSLREAVVAANTNAPVDACPPGMAGGGDMIELTAATFELTIMGAGEDAAATGDLDLLDQVHIHGIQGGTLIDAGGLDRIFDVAPGVTTTFEALELVGGDAPGEAGGAILLRDSCGVTEVAAATVRHATLRQNSAETGGAIYAGSCRGMSILESAIVGNQASLNGGGIAIDGPIGLSRLENSTISGNAAASAGGGIWYSVGPERQFEGWIYTTIARNAAPDGAGVWSDGDPPTLLLSIIAENDGPDCAGFQPDADVIADDSSCFDPVFLADPGLGPLTMVRPATEPDYGGNYTFVHPLLPHSDAIDIELSEGCAFWALDQVGTVRPQDGNSDGQPGCDAGAVEAPAGTAPSPTPPGPEEPSGGGSGSLPDTALPADTP